MPITGFWCHRVLCECRRLSRIHTRFDERLSQKGVAFLPFKTECPPCESVMAVVGSSSLLAQIDLSEVLYQYHVSEIEYNQHREVRFCMY